MNTFLPELHVPLSKLGPSQPQRNDYESKFLPTSSPLIITRQIRIIYMRILTPPHHGDSLLPLAVPLDGEDTTLNAVNEDVAALLKDVNAPASVEVYSQITSISILIFPIIWGKE